MSGSNLAKLVCRGSALTAAACVSSAACAAVIVDGTISLGEYPVTVAGQGQNSNTPGSGGSFNGAFGTNATLNLDSTAGALSLGLQLGGTINNGDVGVLYLDTIVGQGIASTTEIAGTGNPNEDVIAGNSGNGNAELNFGAGFRPDYAITLQDTVVNGNPAVFIGLYRLDPGTSATPIFVDGIDLFGSGTGDAGTFNPGGIINVITDASRTTHELTIALADLGLSVGDVLGYVGTLASPGLYRSNEFFGLSAQTVLGINNDNFFNVANNTFTIPDGENGTYTIVPEPGTLGLATMGALCLLRRTRRR